MQAMLPPKEPTIIAKAPINGRPLEVFPGCQTSLIKNFNKLARLSINIANPLIAIKTINEIAVITINIVQNAVITIPRRFSLIALEVFNNFGCKSDISNLYS